MTLKSPSMDWTSAELLFPINVNDVHLNKRPPHSPRRRDAHHGRDQRQHIQRPLRHGEILPCRASSALEAALLQRQVRLHQRRFALALEQPRLV
jgi:hypothetical protein